MADKPRNDHTLLILAAAIFLLHSPMSRWWSSLQLPWYAMFVPWLAIIAMVALNQWLRSDGGD